MGNQSKTCEKRRSRAIRFTDLEWAKIGIVAKNFRMSKTRYVSSRALQEFEARPHTPSELQLIMAHKAVLKTLNGLSRLLPPSGGQLDLLVAMACLAKIERHLNFIVSLSIGDATDRYGIDQ